VGEGKEKIYGEDEQKENVEENMKTEGKRVTMKG
jgi:hypothetical protein